MELTAEQKRNISYHIRKDIARKRAEENSAIIPKKTEEEKAELRREFINIIPLEDCEAIKRSPFLHKLITMFAMMYAEDPSLMTDLTKEE